MTRKNDCTVNFTELLLNCLGQSDPMLYMLKWLCDKLMEAELSQTIRAEKVKGQPNGKRITADTDQESLIHGWEPCIC